MAKEAAKSKTLPKREEIPERYKWRLEDLFASREEWERVFREAQALIDQIAAYSGTLGQSGQRLLEALRLRDELEVRVERLYAYARMRRDEDATRAEHQALSDRATTLLVQAEAALSFLEPEILSIPEERLRTWLEEVEGLALYRTALENLLATCVRRRWSGSWPRPASWPTRHARCTACCPTRICAFRPFAMNAATRWS